MISALSGAGSRALLSLFGRPKSQAPADEPTPVAQTAALPARPPETSRGANPASLFAAMVDQGGDADALASQAISALDRDGSGTLSAAELSAAYQSVASSGTFASVAGLVSNILSRVDSDGDGAISGSELRAALAGVGQPSAAEDQGMGRLLDQVMAQLDADGNGSVSREEVAQALGQAVSALASATPGIETRPETAPKSMYEAIFSMRLNPEGGDASAQAREAIAARLRDRLMG